MRFRFIGFHYIFINQKSGLLIFQKAIYVKTTLFRKLTLHCLVKNVIFFYSKTSQKIQLSGASLYDKQSYWWKNNFFLPLFCYHSNANTKIFVNRATSFKLVFIWICIAFHFEYFWNKLPLKNTSKLLLLAD